QEALSFVALLDGYYRLTADAHHYFCTEVAPPRLLEDLENLCHGPISSEFAIAKLKRAGKQPGLYLLRRSPQDFDSFLLTVCAQVRLAPSLPLPPTLPLPPAGDWAVGTPWLPCWTRSGQELRRCLIRRDEEGSFWLAGLARRFGSLQELLGTYRHRGLQAEGARMRLAACCPPLPRGEGAGRGDPTSLLPPPRLQGESLAQGSFTQIFKGLRRQQQELGHCHSQVVLKVLDLSHRNCTESFLEAASTMSQLSHKHLVLLHGVSLGKETIMVQEYVRYGPLDLYLKKNQGEGKVTTSWKLQVAKQLAYALNYL
ncbi:JAK3 kinase, partial [Indicator maculatus]|nr:JAK3 kinase [Indicator maculatus]